MRKLLCIAFAVLLLFGCKRDANNLIQPANGSDPKIKSVTFSCVAAGTNQSIRFNVDLISDSTAVNKVELYQSPTTLVWEVNKPTTGSYTMYNHLGDCPSYSQHVMHYFIFTLKDGSKITTEPFQVWF